MQNKKVMGSWRLLLRFLRMAQEACQAIIEQECLIRWYIELCGAVGGGGGRGV